MTAAASTSPADMHIYDQPAPISRPFTAKFNGICAFSGVKIWRNTSQMRAIADGYDPVSGNYLNKRYVLEIFVGAACKPARWQMLQAGDVDPDETLQALCVEGREIAILDKQGKIRPRMKFQSGKWVIGYSSKTTAQLRRSFAAAVAYELIK